MHHMSANVIVVPCKILVSSLVQSYAFSSCTSLKLCPGIWTAPYRNPLSKIFKYSNTLLSETCNNPVFSRVFVLFSVFLFFKSFSLALKLWTLNVGAWRTSSTTLTIVLTWMVSTVWLWGEAKHSPSVCTSALGATSLKSALWTVLQKQVQLPFFFLLFFKLSTLQTTRTDMFNNCTTYCNFSMSAPLIFICISHKSNLLCPKTGKVKALTDEKWGSQWFYEMCVCVLTCTGCSAHTGSHCTFLLTFVFFATYCDFKDESEKSWHSGKETEVIFPICGLAFTTNSSPVLMVLNCFWKPCTFLTPINAKTCFFSSVYIWINPCMSTITQL